MYFDCPVDKTNPSIQACSVPASCCITSDTSTGMDIITNTYCGKGSLEKTLADAQRTIYTDGCFDKIYNHFSSYTVVIVIVILVLIIGPIIQEVCIAFLIYDVNAERQAYEMWLNDRKELTIAGRNPLLTGGGADDYPNFRGGPIGRSDVAPYRGGAYRS